MWKYVIKDKYRYKELCKIEDTLETLCTIFMPIIFLNFFTTLAISIDENSHELFILFLTVSISFSLFIGLMWKWVINEKEKLWILKTKKKS